MGHEYEADRTVMTRNALARRPMAIGICAFVAAAGAARAADFADAAARIEYGYYAEQPAVVRAAAADVERAARTEPEAEYLLGLAALRLAELDADGRDADAGRRLDDCVAAADRAAAAGAAERDRRRPRGGSQRAVAEAATAERAADAATAEALVLGAACETELARREPLKRVLHERRCAQDLERARTLEPANPRAALVAAWAIPREAARDSTDRRRALEARLDAAVAAFAAAGTDTAQAPGLDWGEAEALAQLGELRLLDGRKLEARDLIERALLDAPDYRFALRLEARLAAAGKRDRGRGRRARSR